MNLRTVWFLLFVCGYWLAWPAWAEEIQVSVDRNPVNLNESFQITFSSTKPPDGSPDFAPLQENFQILNQQRSSNVSWVNGKSSRNEQWIVSVMAKQAGELLIPPIAFGSDSSKPLMVIVNDAPVTASSNDEVFLEVQATPEKPYVQSQVLYTLKLYRRVQITQASLNEPEIKDALVEKLGEDSTYSTQINGMDYWVTERKYAIFPQQSGLFTIAPLTLTAEVVSDQRQRFNGFFSRQLTETRRVSSKAVTLNVQPVPPSFTDPSWLSASSLELTESWSDNRLQTKVGEPLTRTIRLAAKGATVGQLPELARQATIDGLKTYPDQPVLNEDKQGDGLVAIREEKIAYIPGKAGEYTLPALEIRWFNTQTEKTEVARLPEVTLKALPVSGNANQMANVQASAPLQPQPDTLSLPPTSDDNRLWQGLAAFFALGWLSTLAWFLARGREKPITKSMPLKSPKFDNEKAVKAACKVNDAQAAKQALLRWGNREFAVDNLAAIADHCASPLRDEIIALNQCLYSSTQLNWQGQTLWQAFNKTTVENKLATKQDEALQPLFRL